ncbi:MAG: glycogen synthase GlgA [Firmicutes bacterium]|nr:glycogen synthase GlgA [Bacillota bacterium]
MRILHTAAEIFPWVKVGGLGDVLAALPEALRAIELDARVLLPAYPALKRAFPQAKAVAGLEDLLGTGPATFLRDLTPSGVPIYLLDAPSLFDRPGGPYDDRGDSHLRFGAFSLAAAWFARHGDEDGWEPEILNCHDWQTALTPVYLKVWGGSRPRTVMTIHNLAYQGLYGPEVLPSLHLPPELMAMDGLEFYGRVNFLKGGLQVADALTTVSPTYAKEIQEPAFGEGLDGLLRHRSQALTGILNGVDHRVWNPATSPHLPHPFSLADLSGKARCKRELQREMGLEERRDLPLFVVVSRLVAQKGLDLMLAAVDRLVHEGGQLAVLGAGEAGLESGFGEAAGRHPGRVAVKVGYDEGLAHRFMGGGDALVVPSRFEPCGLTQLYALAYGALPVVRRTGGLADTVVEGETGFFFEAVDAHALGDALARACHLFFHDPLAWKRMGLQAMAQDFGWIPSAQRYRDLYRSL